ncbi:uncharacterized protein LOC129570768 [Sitodiplosis mosellana]|uniref:uncharacterized protein LOC129570768 n=1 Tax=Sitodiplosis mosellana TaxID=263140 RepID=UPI002443B590|nr:uncharacterized protein LOC129570768 [Sitodiplosis mosellana]
MTDTIKFVIFALIVMGTLISIPNRQCAAHKKAPLQTNGTQKEASHSPPVNFEVLQTEPVIQPKQQPQSNDPSMQTIQEEQPTPDSESYDGFPLNPAVIATEVKSVINQVVDMCASGPSVLYDTIFGHLTFF